MGTVEEQFMSHGCIIRTKDSVNYIIIYNVHLLYESGYIILCVGDLMEGKCPTGIRMHVNARSVVEKESSNLLMMV